MNGNVAGMAPLPISLSERDDDLFEALWKAPAEWIEPPNERRGGWSGAKRISLLDDRGMTIRCVLKKQLNHSYYSLKNGLLPRPTYEREASNLSYLRKAGLNVPKVLYFRRKKGKKADRCLLLLPELVGYRSLTAILNDQHTYQNCRRRIARAVGDIARKLHQEVRWRHNNFYPKHIFVKILSRQVNVCLIDLENARPLWRQNHVMNDLGPLFRRAKKATFQDQVEFIKAYSQSERLNTKARLLMEQIATSK